MNIRLSENYESRLSEYSIFNKIKERLPAEIKLKTQIEQDNIQQTEGRVIIY